MRSTSRKETLLDALLPAAGTSPNFAAGLATHGLLRLAAQLVLVLAGSMLLAASAQFKMVISFSPVPVTGQTLVVLMIGIAYGSRLGAVTVLAYIFAGRVACRYLRAAHLDGSLWPVRQAAILSAFWLLFL